MITSDIKRGDFVKKISAIYFSDNELHRLEVGYGIAALQSINNQIYVKRIECTNFDEALHFIKKESIELFVIFLSYDCYDLLTKTCREIKCANKHSKIVICHSLVNSLYKDLLNEIPQIDIAVLGEYEVTLVELADLILNGKEITSCRGIAFKEDGEIYVNSPRPLANIDKLPFPNRNFDYQGSRFFHIYGSRGCEGFCTFCDRNCLYSNNCGRYVRWRSIESIISEIDYLVENYQCKFICFSDPTFVSSNDAVDRLNELYDALSKKNYWIQFTFNIRAEQINESVIKSLKKLKKYGLGNIFIGIESFNESDLKLYGKRADLHSIKKCVELLKAFTDFTDDYYVKVEYGFINFNPYSTIAGLRNNIQSFKDLRLNLNPYIIASKLTANSLTSISAKIDLDRLFPFRLGLLPLCDALKYKFNYNFYNEDVQEIYSLVINVSRKVLVQNDNGTEFLRNRYIHYYGYDALIKKYDKAYGEWRNAVDEFSYNIFMFILNYFNDNDIHRQIDLKAEKFLDNYFILENKVKGIQQRVLIELKKIDQVIYYKPIFR